MKPIKFINFFANCKVTIGYNRSILIDLQRKNYWYIPNELGSLIANKSYYNVREFEQILHKNFDSNEVNSFLEFLLSEEIAFYSNKNVASRFPYLSNNTKEPYDLYVLHLKLNNYPISFDRMKILEIQIQNLIIETSILINLEEELRFYQNSNIRSISMIISYHCYSEQEINEFIREFPKIIFIKLTESPVEETTHFCNVVIKKCLQKIVENYHEFNIDPKLYFESKKFNPYFYKRAFICDKGKFRNSEHTKIIDNLKNSRLSSMIKKNNFRKYWNASKKITDICNDCEYQRICVDKRIPIKRKNENTWFFKEDCSYNPYISLENNNIEYLKPSELGVVSTSKSFSVNHSIIKEYNKKIWDEQ